MNFQPRPYQRQAVDAIKSELDIVDATVLVASVGAGKTIMQAMFIQEMIGVYPEARFVCAVHTRELVQQNAEAMLRAWPSAPIGINSAALGHRKTRSQILFCSIQSVHKAAAEIGWVDCLIVDEGHLISPKATTMYRQFIDALRAINPDLRILLMSGTPWRLDSGDLTEGENAIAKTVAYEVQIRELIEQGFLTRPISKGTATTFDMTGVHTRGGEYVLGEAEAAVNKQEITESAVREIVQYGQDRKAWLLFCAGVDHAYAVRDEVRRHGVTCETVEGTMEAAERRRILEAYKRGEIRCLTNVNVLSVGFDFPGIDLVALMRPTKSPSLYVQQVGRGLRLSPGKDNVLVLDFANVVRTLGPIDDVKVKKPGKGQGEAPVRQCPDCQSICHASARECPDCGFQFPESDKPKHSASADVVPMLSTEPPAWEPVKSQTFRRHEKQGGLPSVRIDYMVGMKINKVWLCPEHTGFPKSKADRWWHQHGGARPFPKTVDEFLDRAGELCATAEVQIKYGGKWPEIVDFRAGERVEGSNDNMVVRDRNEEERHRLRSLAADFNVPF
jgi:DNA repair protein RadD